MAVAIPQNPTKQRTNVGNLPRDSLATDQVVCDAPIVERLRHFWGEIGIAALRYSETSANPLDVLAAWSHEDSSTRNAALHFALLSIVIALLVGLCFLLADFSPARIFGFLLLGCAALTVTLAAKERFGQRTLVTFFFFAAVAHAVFSYFMAEPSTEAIWIAGATKPLYDRALLIISVGLFVAAFIYVIAIRGRFARFERMQASLQLDDARFLRAAQILLIVGTALILFVCVRIGYIPLLTADPGQARMMNEDLGSGYMVDEWMIARGMDLLTCSLPLVAYWAWNRKYKMDYLLTAVGMLALMIPLRRANIGSVIATTVVLQTFRNPRLQKRLILILLGLVVLYSAVQVSFFNASDNRDRAMAAVGSGFPEVRDLGWILSVIGDTRYDGATLIQPFVPLPSFMSDFSQKYSLRNLTTRLIGMEDSRKTGGLRLTLAGEGYINFGYFGVIAVAALFGWICAAIDSGLDISRSAESVAWRYLWTMALIAIAFWVYLGGTQAAAMVKGSIIILGGMAFVSARRSAGIQSAPEHSRIAWTA